MTESGCKPQVQRQDWGHPELHRLSSTQAGENKLQTKMEMIERKYARVDAKINYKTFTFKMRSWNSSKKESANREELRRHWNRKLDILRAFLSKGFSGHFHPPPAALFWGARYLLEHQTCPFSNTWMKSCAQIKNYLLHSALYLYLCMNPRNLGFQSLLKQ